MKRGDIPHELHFSSVLCGEAAMRGRFGEWNLAALAMTKAYARLRDAAKALDFDLETEAKRLEAEEGKS